MPTQKSATPTAILQFGDRFITPEEVEQITGRKVSTLAYDRAMGGAGSLPFYRVGGRSIRYLLSEVTQWARTGRVQPPEPRTRGPRTRDPELEPKRRGRRPKQTTN